MSRRSEVSFTIAPNLPPLGAVAGGVSVILAPHNGSSKLTYLLTCLQTVEIMMCVWLTLHAHCQRVVFTRRLPNASQPNFATCLEVSHVWKGTFKNTAVPSF